MRTVPAPLPAVARQAPSTQAPPAPTEVSWPAPAGGAAVGRELAGRIGRFYAAHPAGRIVTELVTRAREVVVFRASVYRAAGDAEPAATGWAASGWGVGPAFERAEEAAVARALAHLGFALGAGARPADAPNGAAAPERAPGAEPNAAGAPADAPADPARAALVADLAGLVARAERYGLRARRAAAWRARLRAGVDAEALLFLAEQRLRAWVERRRGEPYGGAV